MKIKPTKKPHWTPTDPMHFEGKTLVQLQQRLQGAEEFIQRHPEFEHGWHNEYRQELKKRIASMIGKKKD